MMTPFASIAERGLSFSGSRRPSITRKTSNRINGASQRLLGSLPAEPWSLRENGLSSSAVIFAVNRLCEQFQQDVTAPRNFTVYSCLI